MADKEERILILTTKNKNGDCECVTQDGCHVNDSCAICNVGMTRQEAIKRIQKRLEEQCWLNDCDSEDVAIECLNALLEGGEK